MCNHVDFTEWIFVTFITSFTSNLHQNFISIHSNILAYFIMNIILNSTFVEFSFLLQEI